MESAIIEPYLMSLLANRINSIAIRMNNAMVKSARSSILALARDCSTAICDGNGDVLSDDAITRGLFNGQPPVFFAAFSG